MQYKNILRVARPILTIFEYAISVLLIAVTAQITLGNSLKSYLITAISIVLGITTYIIWYSDGVDRGEATTSVYNTTLRFHTYARTITNMQVKAKLVEFCNQKNEEFERELILSKLAQFTLSFEELTSYKEKLKEARGKAIIKPKVKIFSLGFGKKEELGEDFIHFCKQFDKQQLKCLNELASRSIKFDKLEPKDLTEAISGRRRIKPKNEEHKHLPSTLISKIVWGVVLGVFTAYIALSKKDAWTTNETIQVLMWAFSISYNIYTSVRAGYKSVVVDKYNYFKDKNELCADFFGFINKPISEVEAESNLQAKLKQ